MVKKFYKKFYEELGRSCAIEFEIEEDSTITHQCGTVWVDKDGKTLAISAIEPSEKE